MRKTPRSGESALHVVGEVKNVGGAEAHKVRVVVTAIDRTRDKQCLHQELAVTPSILASGENGKFDTEVDSPCLVGEPDVDVAPFWE